MSVAPRALSARPRVTDLSSAHTGSKITPATREEYATELLDLLQSHTPAPEKARVELDMTDLAPLRALPALPSPPTPRATALTPALPPRSRLSPRLPPPHRARRPPRPLPARPLRPRVVPPRRARLLAPRRALQRRAAGRQCDARRGRRAGHGRWARRVCAGAAREAEVGAGGEEGADGECVGRQGAGSVGSFLPSGDL